MRKTLLLLLAFSLSFLACNRDDDDDNFNPETTLNLDGPNATAPFLLPGTYEAAARFGANETARFTGKKLTEVAFFIANIPSMCVVRIYDEGTAGEPGRLLYTATVSGSLRAFSWNRHQLRRPLDISGDDIWISIGLVHTQSQQSIGCDAGPSNGPGDWLFQESDNAWRTFRERSGENINWNIRGIVGD
jgi:hypothetical protein